MSKPWLASNTFHHSEFKDIKALVHAKNRRQLTISLCLPTLNEEKTIAKEIIIMKSELMTRFPLIDEIVVVDSGSTDNTLEIAETYGADVYEAKNILPQLGHYTGKGENLWKALHVTRGDILVYLDADIKNIHHRFAYALLGPLLLYDPIKYTKAFYDRPITTDHQKIRATGGGRVTELIIRPLFSLFFPELTQIIQPLSGEYAGYRSLLESISFPIGYGVETSMILDIYEKWGLDVIAQVDLDRRVHRNQDTKALGRMSFVILLTFLRRIEKSGKIKLNTALFNDMIQYRLTDGEYEAESFNFAGTERPPMNQVPEYGRRLNR
jgi:glucosyl-3-phosphoglycerate synthase